MDIGLPDRELQQNRSARALNSVRKHLPNELILRCCHQAGHRWRERLWPPLLTVLACVWKQLLATASARQIEDWARSLAFNLGKGSSAGADFCAARARLPLEVFQLLLSAVGGTTAKQFAYSFHGLPVSILDGTTLRTANTLDNDRAFGRSRNQSGQSRAPLVRLLILVCAGCGAILDASCGAYAVSEWALFLELLPRIPRNCLLLADRGFCSFLMIVQTRQHGCHVLTRLHHQRQGVRLRTLGRDDELHLWTRPRASSSSRPDLLDNGPEELELRVITRMVQRRSYRSVPLTIVTTLLDPREYPADELIDLYLRRWNIELDLRMLKTHYGMEQLSGKSADVVRKEIWSTMLAHNCVTALMVESGGRPRKLSHTRARTQIILFASCMAWVSETAMVWLYRNLLALIGHLELECNPRLPQPRAVVQREHNYPVLSTTRAEWRRRVHGNA